MHDRRHTLHQLQTRSTPEQEAVAVVLRSTLLVLIDHPLAVIREVLDPEVLRSGIDRCLRRHAAGNPCDLQAKSPRPGHMAFKTCEPGCLPKDMTYLPQMADQTLRRHLFIASARATRRVFICRSRTCTN